MTVKEIQKPERVTAPAFAFVAVQILWNHLLTRVLSYNGGF